MNIVLYDYWRSSSAYRLRIALNLLGLKYESRPVNLVAGEQTSNAHLVRNPQGLVPVLEIDGTSMTQSLAIIEYLDETHNAGFLPTDPVARQKVRALAYAIAMEIQPVCNLRVAKFATSKGAISQEEWMRHFISTGLNAFEVMLSTTPVGKFCWGDKPGLADICLVPQIYNAERWGVDLSAFPQLARIGQEMAALPAVASAHPDRYKP